MTFELTRHEIEILLTASATFRDRLLDRLFQLEKNQRPQTARLTNDLKEYIIRNYHANSKIEAIKHVRTYVSTHGQFLFEEGVIKEIAKGTVGPYNKSGYTIGLADAKKLVETWLSEKV